MPYSDLSHRKTLCEIIAHKTDSTPMQNLRSIGSLCGGVWVCGAAFLGLRLIKGVCNKAVGFKTLVNNGKLTVL